MARVIVIDDNLSSLKGHYNELSSLILGAAVDLGYAAVLVANQEFCGNLSRPANCQILRCFTTRRMTRWSCGFDGQSRVARDIRSAPLSPSLWARCIATREHWLTRAEWRPREMLTRWSDGLTDAIKTLQPTEDDHLIFQTADDFMMVAMARALSQFRDRRFSIKTIFHYAVYGANDSPKIARKPFDQQLNGALEQLTHHDVKLFATTDSLADQMNGGFLTQRVHAIPYPLRPPTQFRPLSEGAPRIVIGGVQRVEQGRDDVAPFLEAIYEPFVKTGRCTLTLRLDPKHWRRCIPKSLHAHFAPAIDRQAKLGLTNDHELGETLPALDVQPMTLSELRYFQMLCSGDLGVLLYDADRYKVRCSGILLEFLIRGVPVIVPDNCWLGTIVKSQSHAQQQPIGYAYRNSRDIPDLIERFLANREKVQTAAAKSAPEIYRMHSPAMTLQALLNETNTSSPAESAI